MLGEELLTWFTLQSSILQRVLVKLSFKQGLFKIFFDLRKILRFLVKDIHIFHAQKLNVT